MWEFWGGLPSRTQGSLLSLQEVHTQSEQILAVKDFYSLELGGLFLSSGLISSRGFPVCSMLGVQLAVLLGKFHTFFIFRIIKWSLSSSVWEINTFNPVYHFKQIINYNLFNIISRWIITLFIFFIVFCSDELPSVYKWNILKVKLQLLTYVS